MQSNLKSADELFPLVYDDLKRLAAARFVHERPGNTLQATALVHEAYLRLAGSKAAKQWDNRGHFFAAAAESMRRILIESARRKQAKKRSGKRMRVKLEDCVEAGVQSAALLLDVDEGLKELQKADAKSAELVKLRLFAGLTIAEAGDYLGMSRSTAYEHWQYARSWFVVFWDQPSDSEKSRDMPEK